MDNVLYEAKPFYGVNPACVVFSVIGIVVLILLIIFWGKVTVGVRCLASFILLFFLFIIVCQVYTSFDTRHKVYNKYKEGNYLTIEGTINDYTLAEENQVNLPDTFTVNEVEFQIPGFVTCWGYPLKKIDGGILEDGMRVRICYIPYKNENVIMKLEILD